MAQGIALMGRARSGKDSVAARLMGHHNYSRVAFADPLRDMALALDPWVVSPGDSAPLRLSQVVRNVGWEQAKEYLPEVRRTLQALGQSVRDVDPNFWLRLALDRVDSIAGPVVITDVRYPNEAQALRARGFLMVRVWRPRYPAVTVDAEGLAARQHVSETALDGYVPDVTVVNGGTLADLHARADLLV
jgi:hypothetical protein